MAIVKTRDLPFFQLCNQLPVTSSAISAFTTDETGIDKYIYYLVGSTFYRYSKEGDGWILLPAPLVAPATLISMRYTKRRGHHCKVISATANSVTVGGLIGKTLDGFQAEILDGVGAGQVRTLTYVSDNINDSGVITSTTTSTIVDSTKKWKINQWVGYQLHFHFGTDAAQSFHILYNDATTLYVADANLQPHNPWENVLFTASLPFALPISTAGSQTHYEIRSQTYNTDTN